MSEIKVGDKVRVRELDPSKVASCIHDYSHPGRVYTVISKDGEFVRLSDKVCTFGISAQDLIKVEDEAKEWKFKVGDKVIVNAPANDFIHGKVSVVTYTGRSNKGFFKILYDSDCTIYVPGACLKLYTLEEVLSLLPNKIKGNTLYAMYLNKSWEVGYKGENKTFSLLVTKIKTNLIDALYELLIWCIDNHIELNEI